MISAVPDSPPYFAYGVGCALLAAATVTWGVPRHRLYNRNLWICAAFGTLQSAAVQLASVPEWGAVAVALKLAAGGCFYLFGWLSLRDLGIGRAAIWRGLAWSYPWLGLAGTWWLAPRWLALEAFANLGLCLAGLVMVTVMLVVMVLRSPRRSAAQLRYRAAALGTMLALAAFGALTLVDTIVLLRTGSGLELVALARAYCLLSTLGCVALILRQTNAESLRREELAGAALAARTAELAVLNTTLEERVQERTEALVESNAELEREIGRHRETEAELLETTAQLQALFDQPALGVAFLSPERRYLRVNGRFAELVGRTVPELIGLTPADLCAPEEIARDSVLWDEMLAGRRWFFAREKPYLRPDGTPVWIGVNLILVRDEQQRISHFIGLYEDIGERRRTADALRENERRLQLALSASLQSLFELDVSSRRLRFAPEYATQLGYRPEEFPDDFDRWLELVHPEDRTAALATVWACLEGQTATLRTEFRQSAAGGVWRWITARGSVVERDADGRAVRLLGTLVDNTKRHAFDERLRRTERLESIGSLAGGIAHDLNNALVPLLAGVAFLREYVPAEEEELVQAMETSSRRAAGMVQQLLVFAKGAEGRRTPVQPAALLAEMEGFIHSTFPPSVQLHSSCLCKAAVVAGDPTQLHQVLLNLCVNARDAMPHGGRLGLEARLVEVDAALAAENDEARSGPHVLFTVSDTGTGIPLSIQERIFDPFFTTKGPEKGTGLGLSTVLGIVRGHGGFINLQSAEGEGTRFLVYLPVAGGRPDEPGAAEPATVLPPGRGRCVLVVDDEEVVRTMVSRILGAGEFTVATAVDGVEALAVLEAPAARVDLLLLDMTMPRLGGREVLERLEAQDRRVPTVAMSGNFDRADLAWLRERGVATLAKPFHRDDLVRVVGAVLGGAE